MSEWRPRAATVSDHLHLPFKESSLFSLCLVTLFKHRINSSTNKEAGILIYKDIQASEHSGGSGSPLRVHAPSKKPEQTHGSVSALFFYYSGTFETWITCSHIQTNRSTEMCFQSKLNCECKLELFINQAFLYSKLGLESVAHLHLLVGLVLRECTNKSRKNTVNSLLVKNLIQLLSQCKPASSKAPELADCSVYGLSHMLSIFLWDLCLFLSLCITKDYPTFCKYNAELISATSTPNFTVL